MTVTVRSKGATAMAQFSILLVMAAVMSALLGAFPASADAAQSPDDLSSIACNFFFRLKGGTGASPLDFSVNTLDSSTDCDSYHIYLSNHPTDRSQSTVRISETAATGFMTYHLADMPLNVVVLLLTPERSPTRVLARRETDRITFVV